MTLENDAAAEIARDLEKRATFHAALKALASQVAATAPNNEQKRAALLALLPRVMVLLRTRYSSPAAWIAAQGALNAIAATGGLTEAQRERVAGCTAEAEEFISAHDVEPSPSLVATATEAAAAAALANVPLEDVLLGLQSAQARQGGVQAHYDDTGPILDDPQRLQRVEGGSGTSTSSPGQGAGGAAPGAAAGAAAGSDASAPGGEAAGGEGGGAGAGAGADADARGRLARRAHMQATILEGIQAVYSGISAIAAGTEVIERELDGVLAVLQARQAAAAAASSRPPASRRVVAALPRLVLDEATLTGQLGSDAVCPVCTEALAVGDEVQLLPCKHCYHVACLAPWLQQSNSCPTCRHELPTDDLNYEARKEREAEEARERQGAANALSHNEFAYI